MARNCESIDRRSLLKQFAIGATSITALTSRSSASNSRWDEFRLPSGGGFDTEKEVINSTPGMMVKETSAGKPIVKINRSIHPELTLEEQKELSERRMKTRKDALSGMRKKIPKSEGISTSALPTVTVGNSQKLTDISWGTEDQSSSGDIILNAAGKRANLYEDQSEAALVCSGGAGSATRAAAVGTQFQVDGTGEVTISANGWYNGALTASDASTEARIFFELKDKTTGSYIYSGSDIFSKSFGGYNAYDTDKTYYSHPLSTTLNDGHSYFAYVTVEATVSSNGIGEASADFGPQDNDTDNPDQCAYLENFDLNF